MRRDAKWFFAVGLVASAALVATGCGGCPVCNLVKRGYQAITGSGNPPAAPETPGGPETPKAQTNCPVHGGRINRQLYVDCEGKRIYVCCPACIPVIRKDPARYIQQLEAKGMTLERVPKAGT